MKPSERFGVFSTDIGKVGQLQLKYFDPVPELTTLLAAFTTLLHPYYK